MTAETPTPRTDELIKDVEYEYIAHMQPVIYLTEHARQLERANAALAEQLASADEQGKDYQAEIAALISLDRISDDEEKSILRRTVRWRESEIKELTEQLAEARKDAARYVYVLDLLEKHGAIRFYPIAHEMPDGGYAVYYDTKMLGYGATKNAAIDAASEGKGRG